MAAEVDLPGLALVIGAAAAFLTSLGAFVVTLRRLGHIADAVHTSDGRGVGVLVEQNFASRALHVPEAERTEAEVQSVDQLDRVE